jgi:hypothetical protein
MPGEGRKQRGQGAIGVHNSTTGIGKGMRRGQLQDRYDGYLLGGDRKPETDLLRLLISAVFLLGFLPV